MPALKSKTLAAWTALTLGPLGVHRLYLHGARDLLAWLHLPPTLAGMAGAWRMREFGQDDLAATWLVPLLGLMISQALFTAILWGLTPDERWDARHNPGRRSRASGWGVVLAVILSLMVGGAVLMGTIAYSVQHFFEWQLRR